MKRILAVAILCLSLPAISQDKLIGTLTSTGTTVNQTTTATPFTVPTGVMLSIQCDAAACVRVGSGSGTTASCTPGNAAKGVVLSAGQLYDTFITSVGADAVDTIAVISVSGTVNCDVNRVVPGP